MVTLIAILKAGRDLSKEACALVWRRELVSFLHLRYLRGKMPYVLSTAEAGRDKRGGGGAYINRCVPPTGRIAAGRCFKRLGRSMHVVVAVPHKMKQSNTTICFVP